MPHDQASHHLFHISADRWKKHLIRTVKHQDRAYHVFMHSWSPEVAGWAREAYGTALKSVRHDNTLYVRRDATRLLGRCNLPVHNCARTISQLISISRAVGLKTEFEVQNAMRFDGVFVSRHDLWFERPILLAPPPPDDAVWFAMECGVCRASRPHCRRLSSSCARDERRLDVQDWSFYTSTTSADALALAGIQNFHVHLANTSAPIHGYTATHTIWPFEARRLRLKIHFGMYLVVHDVLLARDGPPFSTSISTVNNIRSIRCPLAGTVCRNTSSSMKKNIVPSENHGMHAGTRRER